MRLTVTRKWKKGDYTIGTLEIDGKYFCDTLEDRDRGLDSTMPLADIKRLKLHGKTAIPTGVYSVTTKVYSAKFGARPFYNKVCKGLLPRLLNVPAYEGVLIHCGNTHLDTEGCILVGYNKVKGQVVNSQAAFEKLYAILEKADEITIEIR